MKKYIGFIFLIGASLSLALAPPIAAQEDSAFPMAETGAYGVGRIELSFTDLSRDNRAIQVEIRYPAIIPADVKPRLLGNPDVEPDISGAPYPLILQSHGWQGSGRWLFLAQHLASRGFVVASIRHRDSTAVHAHIDRPLDILFALDQLVELEDSPLVGMFDADNVGVAGWAFGGTGTLAVSDAQIDPDVYLNQTCPDLPHHPGKGDPCFLATVWDEFVAYAAPYFPIGSEGLWPTLTDERIHAVLSAQLDNGQLYGERGLGVATTPMLVIGFTNDLLIPYEENAAFVYEHLGTDDRYLLTFVGGRHADGVPPREQPPITHYATAFFGLYLQGDEDYANYLTAEYVEPFEHLAWGAIE